MVNDTLVILKKHEVVQQAQQDAQKEYEKLFNAWHSYIKSAVHFILRERFAPEGLIGYLIRVEFDNGRMSAAKFAEIKAWAEKHISSDFPVL